jgi:uncharacterized membrane protein HdeD (DUF308 family)
MKLANFLRAIVFAVAAAFLIFNQDHTVTTGTQVLQFVATALSFGGLVLFQIDKNEDKKFSIVYPSAIAALVVLLTIIFTPTTEEAYLAVFTGLLATFSGMMAATEFFASRVSESVDKMELRISAGIGALFCLIFWFAPLNGLNAVGFFSAYLAIIAVQRGVWLATPKVREQNGK